MPEQPPEITLDIQDLISATEALIQSSRNLLSSCHCKGTGSWETDVTYIGDLTFRHNTETVNCTDPKCLRGREVISEAEEILEVFRKNHGF